MEQEIKKVSGLGKLHLSDGVKALITAVGTAVMTVIYQIIQQEGLNLTTENLKLVATTAILAALGYLLKNLSTNSEGRMLKKEVKKYIKKK